MASPPQRGADGLWTWLRRLGASADGDGSGRADAAGSSSTSSRGGGSGRPRTRGAGGISSTVSLHVGNRRLSRGKSRAPSSASSRPALDRAESVRSLQVSVERTGSIHGNFFAAGLQNKARLKVRSVTTDPLERAQNALRLDLYHELFRMPLPLMILSLFVVYLVLNLIFAGFFMIGGDAAECTNTDGTYGELFFFSIQTFSTIGYGGFAPACTYHHIVVVVESFVGLVSVAMMTGLLFSKLARPGARIMFSQVCVLPFHRRPYPELQVRLANARMDAGKLIDANVSLAVIRLIPTPEGGLERHVEDLPLLQSKHPLFQLTWNIVHVLGPDSPLVDKSHPFSRADLHLVDFEAILCSISAIEDKYAQTVHARRIYLPDDFRVACTFKTMRLEPAANRGEILLDLSQIGAYERQQPDSDARASNGSEWRPSNSALCDAAAKGDVGSVHRLLQDRAVDAASADYDGRTALHLASCNGHTAVVNLLLDSGADASAVDHFGKTPLQEAVGAEAFATADVLLARGGKLLLVDESSVLCTLAFNKDAHTLGNLLRYGADPDAADYDGRSALMIAAAEDAKDCIRELLEAGADPDRVDRWGQTAQDEARRAGNDELAMLLHAAATGSNSEQVQDAGTVGYEN